jgi:DNA-binding response OmpR family regulator
MNKHITIVETEPWMIELAREVFEENGVSVYVVHDLHGLQTFLSTDTDLIIICCTMISDEARQLIEYARTTDVPFVVYATLLTKEQTREVFLQGASDVTLKPEDGNVLLQHVSDVFTRIEQKH